MVYLSMCGYCIILTRSDESMPFLAFERDVASAIFLKYSKEGRVSSSHVRIRNISLDVCLDDTKNLQVQSEHKHIHKPFKHLALRVFG